MTPNQQFLPHREVMPRRLCVACEAVLCSSNRADTCWPCGRRWSEPQPDRELTRSEKSMLMDAVNEILQTA